MKAGFIKILTVIAALVLVILVAGYGGRIHPVGDSLAVFRAYESMALVVLGLVLAFLGGWKRGGAFAAIGVAVVLTLGIVPIGNGSAHAVPAGGQTVYHHYQKNLLFVNRAKKRLLADIIARDPDTVTLQETHKRNRIVWEGLAEVYPTAHRCEFVGVGGVAVYARWPAIEGTEFCEWGLAGVQVEGPEGPLWVISTHLHWVWPYENAEHVAEITPALAALSGPKVIGGDFNTVPWTTSFQDFRKAADVERMGRVMVSIVKFHGLLRVPIDHVLATGGAGETERLPLLGSDHRGLWAEFTMSQD